ncbi:OmpW/AlkL family protein [Sphingomonas abietis]|uniref:OmpW family protein n=1 Tax=Sphingomonas abietis TaxID=3012344 RepID=A0ABY7NMU8_9SPHN|nr:OmpW family protein [Sphingomonas abietis]WBO22838.1 OmpW family protein [Sphingomonas abietis]
MNKALLAALGIAIGAMTAPAYAQTEGQAPTRSSDDFQHWIVRLRAIRVTPTEHTGPIEPTFPTANTAVSNSWAPELDFTYMATKHIGAELILGTTKHDVSGRGSLDSLGKAGHTWVLPPTLTLQYHFLPDGHIRPYVGVGVNYTIFYSEKASDGLQAAIGKTKFGMSDSVGYALQAGVDVDITRRVFVNFDLKYLDIDSTAKLTTGSLVNREHVRLDPLVPGVGIGMRF